MTSTMKSIRKSLNGNKDSVRNHISTPMMPLPSVSKPASAMLPPKKVIKATTDYRSQAPQELSFKKGDFFYVIKDVNDQGAWYEAHNPVSGARGLVPKALFEEFNKSSATRNSQAIPLGLAPPALPSIQTQQVAVSPQPKTPKSQVFYAIVLHDFEAERADELEAKRGDAITVVAQSNREWFVAKPIGRLGRPGLIPVSFVEIHDPTTGEAIQDVGSLMDRGDLPRVEEWKRAMMSYKQNSIALGVLDAPGNRESIPSTPFLQSISSPPMPASEPAIHVQGPSPSKRAHPPTNEPPRNPTPECLPEGILLFAEAVSFHYEMEEYWFRVNALFQPYPPPGSDTLPLAKSLILFRVYNDFYDFQVALLNTFPREAGRDPPHPRILPYMPGPTQDVNDALTATRRGELDDYLRSLCSLSRTGAKYILEHRAVREFLALKPGDVENDTDPRVEDYVALQADENINGEYATEIRDTVGKLKLDDEKSDGSDYEDEGYARSPQRRPYDRHPYGRPEEDRRPSEGSLRLHAHSQNHHRNGSTSSFQRSPSPYSPNSRPNSPTQPTRDNDPYYSMRQSGNRPPPSHTASSPSISSVRSAAPSVTGRSRSHSSANTTPISAVNPQTAFVKIKIFDRVADDLIAIRVHPLVTHSELMEKVQTRLGSEVSNLRYRDSVNNNFIPLNNDSQLRVWMDGTDKHVLYAD